MRRKLQHTTKDSLARAEEADAEAMTSPRDASRTAFFLLFFLLYHPAIGGPKNRVKQFVSPDKTLLANVLTAEWKNGTESKIEFRKVKGKLLGGKSFLSRDHEHGLGVIKAEWTLDSKFFVFSTIASGGHQPGHFPTFFYSRLDTSIHLLDKFVGIWITSPDFVLLFPDSVSLTVRDKMPDGAFIDTLSRIVCLHNLHEKH